MYIDNKYDLNFMHIWMLMDYHSKQDLQLNNNDGFNVG